MALLRAAAVVVLLAGAAMAQAPAAAAPAAAAAAAAAPANAWEALNANGLTVFARAAELSGLKPYLSTNVTRATIFVPTNAALTKLLTALKLKPADLELVHNHMLVDRIVGYHISLDDNVASKAITDGAAIKVNGGALTLGKTRAGAVTVKGAQNTARVTRPDIVAGNVTIHVIDDVLLPPTVFPTIAAALASSPKVSTLAKLVAADPVLSKAAADPTTNVTLLAPVNKVIDPVLADPALKAVVSDPKAVSKILAFHAIKGAQILPPFKAREETLPTLLAGQSLNITKVVSPRATGNIGRIKVTPDYAGAKPVFVKSHNIIAGASFIDVIDGVLIPKL